MRSVVVSAAPDSRGAAMIYLVIIELFIGAGAKVFFRGKRAGWSRYLFNRTQIKWSVRRFCACMSDSLC